MNKKLSLLLAAGIISLAACGSDNSNTTANQDKEVEASSDANQTEDSQEEENTEDDEATEDEVTMDDNGEIYEEGYGLMRTLGIGLNKDIGIEGSAEYPSNPIEFGEVTLKLNNVSLIEIEPEPEGDMSYLFDDKELVRAIVIDMELENGTEDDITFHPNQATIVTSAGEQVESDIMLMGDVGGDIYSGVKKADQTWWILENLDDDVETLTVIINPPYYTESWEDIGEEQRFEFEILSWEEAIELDGVE